MLKFEPVVVNYRQKNSGKFVSFTQITRAFIWSKDWWMKNYRINVMKLEKNISDLCDLIYKYKIVCQSYDSVTLSFE